MEPLHVVGLVVAHVALIALVVAVLVRRRPSRDDDATPREGRGPGERPG